MRWTFLVVCCAALAGCAHAGVPSALPAPYGGFARSQTSAYRTIFHFNNTKGTAPGSGLIAYKGELYGTTLSGGKYGAGTVYKITASGDEHVVHSFQSGVKDGVDPLYGNLIVVNGVLYGTTQYGGKYSDGTVYRVTTTGHEKIVYSFKGGRDGTQPWGGLALVKGVLYGTTYIGGTSNLGTVFKLTLSGDEHVLHSFGGSDGANPVAGLTEVGGMLYGTTLNGGASQVGTVFKISTAGSEHVIHSFAGAPANDGATPSSALTDVNGKLYGTTQNAGNSASMTPWGTVYSVSTTGTEKVVHTFANGPDGANPLYGGLTYLNGALYGVTSNGGTPGLGTIFKLTPSGTETVLYAFHGGSDGQLPYGPPVELGGTLYGTTFEGGNSQSNGTAYRISP